LCTQRVSFSIGQSRRRGAVISMITVYGPRFIVYLIYRKRH
jgi:hypothetical protein